MKYLNDSTQYAIDLTSAVEANDWEQIKNTQATLAAETMTAMVSQAAQAEQGKQAAVTETARKHQGFESFYGTDDYREVLKRKPSLANAISFAEGNQAVQQDLPDLYELVWDSHKAEEFRQARRANRGFQSVGNEEPHQPLSEEEVYRATQESKRVDLSKSNRPGLIRDLEERGIADAIF